MLDWLAARAAASPGKPALEWPPDKRLRFADLSERAGRWSAWLRTQGVRRGDRVALLLETSSESAALVFAVMRTGAVLVPLNTRLSVRELRYQLRHAEAKLLLSSVAFESQVQRLQTEATCVFVGDPVVQARLTLLTPLREGRIRLDATFCLMFTSGTTGAPKAVRLSLGNFFYSANASAYRLSLSEHDLWLCTLPLYHVGGLSILLRSCLYGTGVRLEPFDPAQTARTLATRRVSLVSLVPTMLYRLLQEPLKPSATLRHILLGGAAASETLLAEAQERALPVATTYGLTEACSQVATAAAGVSFAKPGTVGKPLMFTELKVTTLSENGAEGEPAPPETSGELWVRGPSVMQGYLNSPDANADVLRAGWLRTGDMGYLDEEGDLFVVQRRRDLIISGGENVYPAEVESVLAKHPQVTDVSVLGIEHPEWGQQVVAAVVISGEGEGLEASLDTYCRRHLAAYKCPRQYRAVKALPLTASGKVKKHELVGLFD